MAGICACGRPVQGAIGRRCGLCQKAYRTENPRRRIAKVVRPDPRLCPAHLAWVRTLPCCVPGCTGRSQAAHYRGSGDGGVGLKPSDRYAFPCCAQHHREQHTVGERAFQVKYGIDLHNLVRQLAGRSRYLPIP